MVVTQMCAMQHKRKINTWSSSSLLAISISPFSSRSSTVFTFSSFSWTLSEKKSFISFIRYWAQPAEAFKLCPSAHTHTSSGTGPKPVGRQSAWGESNTEDESTRTMHNHIPTYWIKKKNSQGTQLTWSEICACRFLRIAFSDTLSLCKACRWREEGAIVGIALLI